MEYPIYEYYPLITSLCKEQLGVSKRYVHYLEIGTQDGGSANAALESGRVEFAVLVDDWGVGSGGAGHGNPDHVVKRFGPDWMKRILILSGNSHEIVPRITHKFDVIFVDGDHSPDGCLNDMNNCLRLLSANGVMLVDDTDHPAHTYIRKLTADFAAANNLTITYHALQFGCAELRRKA